MRCRLATYLLLVSSLATAVASTAQTTERAEASTSNIVTSMDLADYQWQNRLVLLLAPSAKSPAYEQQLRLFKGAQAGFEERDVLVGVFLAQGASRLGEKKVRDADARRVRDHFGIADDQFALLLVGKDGAEKRRDLAPVRPETLFEEIDAMPMRRAEMKRQ